ncbi:metal-sensing transcriptional repressor [Hymenobacter sp. BT188]|uniref:metal-sensing transcriptional repressor n=1 Tax=Hymenobacter sp. BT188 TaxID=2763504 RepID=UPI0016515910|nr:metal-sensing transcriptional repressor [Hymenobacter sp. BT188]MBC6609055.1 metal-sensing transcriptional repressor [Hymenobacter sp. BT188]
MPSPDAWQLAASSTAKHLMREFAKHSHQQPCHLTRLLKSRLNMLASQLQGIGKMLDAETTEPKQILVKFKAVTNGLRSAGHLILDEVFRKGSRYWL